MGDGISGVSVAELGIPKDSFDSKQTNNKENPRPLLERSWSEIRQYWLDTSYADYYQRHLSTIGSEESLKVNNNPSDREAIEHQLKLADTLLIAQELARPNQIREYKPGAYTVPDSSDPGSRYFVNKDGKIFIQGNQRPKHDSEDDVLTRLYLAVDPRGLTQAFVKFAQVLKEKDVLKGVDVALNLEPMGEGKIAENGIIVYVFKSQERQHDLDLILEAYRELKSTTHWFDLTQEQKDALKGRYLSTFRCQVDPNLTFVEIARGEESGDSWDAGTIERMYDALNVPFKERTPANIVDALRKKSTWPIWTKRSKETAFEVAEGKSNLPDGSVLSLRSNRVLGMPALVQYKDHPRRKLSNRLEPISV